MRSAWPLWAWIFGDHVSLVSVIAAVCLAATMLPAWLVLAEWTNWLQRGSGACRIVGWPDRRNSGVRVHDIFVLYRSVSQSNVNGIDRPHNSAFADVDLTAIQAQFSREVAVLTNHP
jgi:hypothetical protein